MQCKAIDQEVQLHSSERSFQDRFGRSLTISGDTVAVGAPGDNDRGDFSGAVYVFLRKADTFTEQAKLTADDGFRDSYFGQDVSIFGDAILIGADRDSLSGKKARHIAVRLEVIGCIGLGPGSRRKSGQVQSF
eukprot:g31546.t1